MKECLEKTFDARVEAARQFRKIPSRGDGTDYMVFPPRISQQELDAICYTLREEGIKASNAAGELFVEKEV